MIAKANSSHPGTTRSLAEEAFAAAQATGMPAGAVQLIYRISHEDGERLRETGLRSSFRMIPARAGMWVNGTHLTWRQLSILFGRPPVPDPSDPA